MVFYRKYRPQRIEDLDSQAVRETLLSVLKNPSHAYLFTGPKGLGKTSTARIIAKVVNCTNRKNDKDLEPCNKCDQCDSINKGTNMDILEIDAASNRGIDEIRDLKEKIRLSPLSAKMKVYIIDEVHMLTTEAFNALLKTLEEPPAHAMFMLCTTEPQKVPATIISRCLHISFKKATDEELTRAFERIVLGEKISIDKDTLFYIASLSDGSFRDGTKILEEVALLAGGKQITKKMIEEKYNVSGVKHLVAEFLKTCEERNTKEALQIIAKLAEQGTDFKYFIQELINVIHEMMLMQMELKKNTGELPKVNLSIEEIKNLFSLLSRAHAEIKYAVLPQLPLELVAIEWGTSANQQSAESSEVHMVNEAGVSVISLRKQVGNIKKNQAMYGTPADKPGSSVKPESAKSSVSLLHASSSEVTPEWLDNMWKNVITEMKSYNHTIAGLLRGCRLKSYNKTQIVIETSYKFHKERLDDIKTNKELVRVCKLLTGKEMAVVVELKKT